MALVRWLSWLEHHPIHIPRLQVQSLVGAQAGYNRLMFLNQCFSPLPSSLSKSSKHILR